MQRGLTSAAGFLRNALSKSLMIRYTPTLTFELDTSIEHGVRLTQLIDSVNKPRDPRGRAGEDMAPDDNARRRARDSPARQAARPELRRRGGAPQMPVQCAQGGPHRFAGSARIRDAPDLLRRSNQVRGADARCRQDLSRHGPPGGTHAERRSGIGRHRAARVAALSARSVWSRRSRSFRASIRRSLPCIRRIKQDGKPLYEYARAGE